MATSVAHRLPRYSDPRLGPASNSLVHWWRCGFFSRLTFGAAMRKTGTSPPAVTLSGTATGLQQIQIEITSTGTLTAGVGTAVLRWTKDGGANWTSGITITSSLALTGTGRTAAFPDGTYTSNNVYKEIVTDVGNGVFGKGAISTAGTAGLGPVLEYKNSNFGGRANLYFPGDVGLKHSATEPGSGNDQPVTVIWCGAHAVAPTAGSTVNAAWAFQDSANSGNGTLEFTAQAVSSASKWAVNKRDDAASNTSRNGGTADTSVHAHSIIHSGTTVVHRKDRVQTTLSSSALDKGVTTLSTFTMAGASTSALFYEYRMGDVLIFNTALSDFACSYYETGLMRYYGLI